MIADEVGIQKALQKQEKLLRKSGSFTPFLKWAPKGHTKYKREKNVREEKEADLEQVEFDIEQAELTLYENIIKEQVTKGRNMIRQYRTCSIERISEKDEEEELETARSIEREYKKDSATTTSSSTRKRSGKDSLKVNENLEDLVYAYKQSCL